MSRGRYRNGYKALVKLDDLEKEYFGEGGSGWGIHVNPWLIHVNVWQKPLQYYKVISLQLIKINGGKKKNAFPWNPFLFFQFSSVCPSIYPSSYPSTCLSTQSSTYLFTQPSSVAGHLVPLLSIDYVLGTEAQE